MILYLLVTRVPSMSHLAGDENDFIDGVPVGDLRESSLVSMGRDLRIAYLRRRSRNEEIFLDDGSGDPSVDEEADETVAT